MSPYKKQQIEKRRKSLYRKWHRRIGFTASVFLLNLAVTGVLLNHSDDLALHNQYVNSKWLITWFGITAPENLICTTNKSKTNEICQLGDKIYSNNKLLAENSAQLISVFTIENLKYLITANEVSIYTPDEQLVEVLSPSGGMPTPISKAFLYNTPHHDAKGLTLAIIADKNNYRLNLETMIWSPIDDSRLTTAAKTELSYYAVSKIGSSKRLEIVDHYLTKQISYLKVIQDLHSGQMLGITGKTATDILGLVIILLAITGFITWRRRKTTLS